jgi:cytochrome P450
MEPDLSSWSTPARCARRQGKVDLIDDFAAAIPIEVIGNLLDVPHDERALRATGRSRFSARSSRGAPDVSPAATRR